MSAAESRVKPYSVAIFRVVFGLYTFVFWVRMLLSYESLFGSASVPKQTVELFYRNDFLKDIFSWSDNVFIAAAIVGGTIALCIASTGVAQVWRRGRISQETPPALFFLSWLCLALFFIRHPGVRSIHVDYLGWLMVINVFVSGKAMSFPLDVGRAAWIFFAIGYVLSGIRKLTNPFWISGLAVGDIVTGYVGRTSDVGLLARLFHVLSPGLSYSVIAIELGAALTFVVPSLRLNFLCLSGVMHLGILIFLRIPDLTLALLLWHVFLYFNISRSEVGRDT